MLTLRPYQKSIIGQTHGSMAAGNRRPLVVAPTGSGKTAMFAWMAAETQKKGKTVWFLVHRAELYDQTIETFNRFGIERKSIYVGMIRRQNKDFPEPDLIVFDECFPAGTLVDGIPIEEIRVGDYVNSFNHEANKIEIKRVCQTHRRKIVELIKIDELVCTPNHPIYCIEEGDYVEAKNIRKGQHLLCVVQKESNLGRFAQVAQGPMDKKQKNLLLKKMREGIFKKKIKRNNDKNKQKVCVGADEKKQPYVGSRNKRKNAANVIRDRAQANSSRWKWGGDAGASEKNDGCTEEVKPNSGVRCLYQSEEEKLSQVAISLQNRRRPSGTQGGHRSRREQSRCVGAARAGQEEGHFLEIKRVESVEILQQGSDGEFERLCPGGQVYNLGVDDNNNYFANNILVHNCHHSSAATWRRLIDRYPACHMIGLTATPCRLDGAPLGEIYDDLIVGVSTADLIASGYLSSYRMIVADVADLSGLKTRGADYDRTDAESRLMERAVYGDVIKAFRKYASDAQAIYFCTTIKHSEATAEAFRSAGIRAEHFDGNTPSKKRDELIQEFRNGDIQILSNCELIGEGFDMPACDAIGMLRPTQSLTIYLQQVGRALRPRPGKTATLIDHVGNIQRHGSPSEPRQWSLEGKIKTGRAVTEEGEFAIRCCTNCFAAYEVTRPRCPVCGAEYVSTMEEIKQIRDVKMRILEEKELERERKWALSPEAEKEARSYSDLCKIAKHKGYKTGWAYHKAKARGLWIPY